MNQISGFTIGFPTNLTEIYKNIFYEDLKVRIFSFLIKLAQRVLQGTRLSRASEKNQIPRSTNLTNIDLLNKQHLITSPDHSSSVLESMADRVVLQMDQTAPKNQEVLGNSENVVKTQIWSAVSTYVLIAIIRKELKINTSLYTILQILSVSVFEKSELSWAFEPDRQIDGNEDDPKQLNLLGF